MAINHQSIAQKPELQPVFAEDDYLNEYKARLTKEHNRQKEATKRLKEIKAMKRDIKRVLKELETSIATEDKWIAEREKAKKRCSEIRQGIRKRRYKLAQQHYKKEIRGIKSKYGL